MSESSKASPFLCEAPSLRGVLLWGNCAYHMRAAKEGTWQRRAVHVVIAASEAFPVVGQIVSLVETVFALIAKPLPKEVSEPQDASKPGVEPTLSRTSSGSELLGLSEEEPNKTPPVSGQDAPTVPTPVIERVDSPAFEQPLQSGSSEEAALQLASVTLAASEESPVNNTAWISNLVLGLIIGPVLEGIPAQEWSRNIPVTLPESSREEVGALPKMFVGEQNDQNPPALTAVLEPEAAQNEKIDDDEEMLKLIEEDPLNLSRASDRLKDHLAVVAAAVEKDGLALAFASEELQDDEWIVELAVRQNGRALKYASKRLRGNKEIVGLAINQDARAIRFVAEQMQQEKPETYQELCRVAIKKDPSEGHFIYARFAIIPAALEADPESRTPSSATSTSPTMKQKLEAVVRAGLKERKLRRRSAAWLEARMNGC